MCVRVIGGIWVQATRFSLLKGSVLIQVQRQKEALILHTCTKWLVFSGEIVKTMSQVLHGCGVHYPDLESGVCYIYLYLCVFLCVCVCLQASFDCKSKPLGDNITTRRYTLRVLWVQLGHSWVLETTSTPWPTNHISRVCKDIHTQTQTHTHLLWTHYSAGSWQLG